MNQKQSERIVNRHYIGVVKEFNGRLRHLEVDIPQDSILIEEIDTMKDNDNRTRMDVQQRFTEVYPEEVYRHRHYDYLYPKKYSDAYVSGVGYPRILTYEEYKQSLEEHEKWLREDYINSDDEIKKELEKLKKESEEKYNERVEEIVAEKMKKYIDGKRNNFDYKRFLYAENYTAKLKEIKQDAAVRMYSTDQIGWKEFEYKANDDITVYIKSNFGYGSASYFFCNLKYKDINILPYTAIIKYYYVQMVDFIRYTRRYATRRDSWGEVFDFAVLTGNLAKHEPEKFVKEWIVNEIEEMMVGIRKIMSSPREELERYLGFKRHIDIGSYRIFRNCTTQDIKEYEVLPNEKVIAFKAEKITGCLLLLDNLRKLTEIAPVIIPYIEEIELMNQRIQPEVEKYINSLTLDIKKLNDDLDNVLKELGPLDIIMKRHKEEIEKLKKEMNEKSRGGKVTGSWIVYSTYDAEQEYKKTRIDYTKTKQRHEELTEKKEKLERRIRRRENFLSILMKCKKRIAKYIGVA